MNNDDEAMRRWGDWDNVSFKGGKNWPLPIPLLLEGVAEGQGSDANRLAEGHPYNFKD